MGPVCDKLVITWKGTSLLRRVITWDEVTDELLRGKELNDVDIVCKVGAFHKTDTVL